VHTKIASMPFENIALEILQHVPVLVSSMVDARLGEVDWHDRLPFPLDHGCDRRQALGVPAEVSTGFGGIPGGVKSLPSGARAMPAAQDLPNHLISWRKFSTAHWRGWPTRCIELRCS
jgi:hypothetical protein